MDLAPVFLRFVGRQSALMAGRREQVNDGAGVGLGRQDCMELDPD
jgi:hypothetical protein